MRGRRRARTRNHHQTTACTHPRRNEDTTLTLLGRPEDVRLHASSVSFWASRWAIGIDLPQSKSGPMPARDAVSVGVCNAQNSVGHPEWRGNRCIDSRAGPE